MSGVAIGDRGQDQQLVGVGLADATSDTAGTDQVDVQWQVVTVLFDRSTGNHADLVGPDRLVDLRPGQFFVSVFTISSAGHLLGPRVGNGDEGAWQCFTECEKIVSRRGRPTARSTGSKLKEHVIKIVLALVVAVLIRGDGIAMAADPVAYSTRIKPILVAHCYACHGALKQESGLRLDTGALAR